MKNLIQKTSKTDCINLLAHYACRELLLNTGKYTLENIHEFEDNAGTLNQPEQEADLYQSILQKFDDFFDQLAGKTPEPIFLWTDLTGRGETGQMSLSTLTSEVDCQDEEYNTGDLYDWAHEAEVGDEWEARTERYTRIS